MFLVFLGCGSRTGLITLAATTDGTPSAPDAAWRPDDLGARGDARGLDAKASACNRLETLATVTLGNASPDSRGSAPSIAFDGTRFGVAWRGRDSSKKSSLRFTLIDAAGEVSEPAGALIGDGVPSLIFHEALARYVVLSAGSSVRLDGLDREGNLLAPGFQVIPHSVAEAALAPRLDGYTILYQEKDSASPLQSRAVSTDGTFTSHTVDSSDGHYLLWLAPHGSGLAAAWGSHLVQLSLGGALTSDFGEVVDSFSPSFAVTPSGFSVAYLSLKGGTPVKAQLLDDQGQPRGAAQTVPVQATFGAAVRRWISLAWTGNRHVLAYLNTIPSTMSGVEVQLLDADLKAVGSAVQLPACGSGSSVASASGPPIIAASTSRVAVAYDVYRSSNDGQPQACVAMLRCVP